MTLSPPSSHFNVNADPLAVALGYVAWNMNPAYATAATTPTSQTPVVAALYVPAGLTITGAVMSVTQAGAGTTPTGVFFGITSPTKMLAQSANLNGSATLTTTGPQQYPFSAPYVTSLGDSPTNLYYVYCLINGTFGTTQVTFTRGTGAGNSGRPLTGQQALWGSAGAGVATPPANGGAVTITFGSIAYWVALY